MTDTEEVELGLQLEFYSNLQSEVLLHLEGSKYERACDFLESHPHFLYHYIPKSIASSFSHIVPNIDEDYVRTRIFNHTQSMDTSDENLFDRQLLKLANVSRLINEGWQDTLNNAVRVTDHFNGAYEDDGLMEGFISEIMVQNTLEDTSLQERSNLVLSVAAKFLDSNPNFTTKIHELSGNTISKADAISKLLDPRFIPFMIACDQLSEDTNGDLLRSIEHLTVKNNSEEAVYGFFKEPEVPSKKEDIRETVLMRIAQLIAINEDDFINNFLQDRALLPERVSKEEIRRHGLRSIDAIKIFTAEDNSSDIQRIKQEFTANFISRFIAKDPEDIDVIDHEAYANAIDIIRQVPHLVDSLAKRLQINRGTALDLLLNYNLQSLYFDANLHLNSHVSPHEVITVLDRNSQLTRVKESYEAIKQAKEEKNSAEELNSSIDYLKGRLDRRNINLWERVEYDALRMGLTEEEVMQKMESHISIIKLLNFVGSDVLQPEIATNVSRFILRKSSPILHDPIPGATFDTTPTGNISPNLNRYQVIAMQLTAGKIINEILNPSFNPANSSRIHELNREMNNLNSIVKFLGKYGVELRDSYKLGGDEAVTTLLDLIRSQESALSLTDINALNVQCRTSTSFVKPEITKPADVVSILEDIIAADPSKLSKTTTLIKQIWFNINDDTMKDDNDKIINDDAHYLLLLNKRIQSIKGKLAS